MCSLGALLVCWEKRSCLFNTFVTFELSVHPLSNCRWADTWSQPLSEMRQTIVFFFCTYELPRCVLTWAGQWATTQWAMKFTEPNRALVVTVLTTWGITTSQQIVWCKQRRVLYGADGADGVWRKKFTDRIFWCTRNIIPRTCVMASVSLCQPLPQNLLVFACEVVKGGPFPGNPNIDLGSTRIRI